jgi:predicted DNA-binding protein with PD1-like motif
MMHLSGMISRIVVFKLRPGSDFCGALNEACKAHDVRSGCVLTAIGSLDGADLKVPVPRPEVKFAYGYGPDPIRVQGPLALASMSGFICHADDGSIEPHLHVVLADSQGKTWAGHLCLDNVRVLLTVECVVGEFGGIDMRMVTDEERGIRVVRMVAREKA